MPTPNKHPAISLIEANGFVFSASVDIEVYHKPSNGQRVIVSRVDGLLVVSDTVEQALATLGRVVPSLECVSPTPSFGAN